MYAWRAQIPLHGRENLMIINTTSTVTGKVKLSLYAPFYFRPIQTTNRPYIVYLISNLRSLIFFLCVAFVHIRYERRYTRIIEYINIYRYLSVRFHMCVCVWRYDFIFAICMSSIRTRTFVHKTLNHWFWLHQTLYARSPEKNPNKLRYISNLPINKIRRSLRPVWCCICRVSVFFFSYFRFFIFLFSYPPSDFCTTNYTTAAIAALANLYMPTSARWLRYDHSD